MPSLPMGYNTKELEKGVTNKWRWAWLSEVDDNGEKWGIWLEKPDLAGVAKCGACDKKIKYGSSGKKAIKSHSSESDHMIAVRVKRTTQVIPGSSVATPKTESIQDRVAAVRAITCAFISEHNLPFSIVADLLGLAKRLSEDDMKRGLAESTLSQTSATNITTHGVATNFNDDLKENASMQLVKNEKAKKVAKLFRLKQSLPAKGLQRKRKHEQSDSESE